MNKDRRATQSTAGTFAFQRPGKFRWTYDKPFDQLIVRTAKESGFTIAT